MHLFLGYSAEKGYLCAMKDGYHIVLDRILPVGEAAEEGKAACHVHLLVADVSELMADEELLAQQTATLSPQRQAKATAIGNLRNRALSVGVALLFDRLLQEVGLREKDMEYVEGEHGKPETVVNFNLSHSGRMVAAAMMLPFRDSTDTPPSPIHPTPQSFRSAPCEFLEVSSDKVERTLEESLNFSRFQDFKISIQLGLDIQHITRYRPELVRRMFNDADRARLAACTDETTRQRLFAQLWCRAEAFAKATGEGLRWPFPTPPNNAHFTDFEVGEEYCGSVCVIEN